jgi:hypothetical protein
LTTAPRIKPTSIFLRSARRPNPGRRSTYRRGIIVQTTGTGSKREEMIAGGFGHKAKSILTYVDKFEKKIPGIREHYEFISEWCHPNGSGHLFTYGEINKQNGSVRFSEATERVRGIQGHIMGCFMLILFMEPIMAAFDEIIPKVSEIDPNVGPWILDPTGWGQL